MTAEIDNFTSPSDAAAIAEGFVFDGARADAAIAWIERTFEVRLYQWQRAILRQYFAWRRADGAYRFTRLIIFIPKKNGKSWLIAVLLAYKLFELKSARLYSAAVNAKQAKIICEEVIRIFRASPKLKRLMTPRTGKLKAFCSPFRRDITCEITGTRYEALADNVQANDGLIPDVLILDELHRMTNKAIDVLEGGTSNNPNALKVIISTAGTGDKTHRSWQSYQYAKKVIAGEVVDPQTLAVVYECANAADLEGDAIYDLDLLVACNPVLREDAAKRAQAAKEIEEARHKRNDAWWRRFRLNQWLATDGELYITPAEYAATETRPMGDEQLQGYDCFVGIDRGGTWDFSAATLLFELGDGKTYERHITYAVADRIEEMNEADDQDYKQYAERGELVIVPAEVVMDEWLAEHLKGVLAKFNIKTIAADAYNAAYILESLAAQGWEVVKVSQSNNRALTPVIEDYANRYRQGRIIHPANSLVAWQLTHARKYQTSKDSVKIVKAGSNTKGQGGTGHIDNIDSALNALAALRAEALKNAAGTSGVTVA